ncbi:hypothetical protein PGTUg99_034186 [Puccinia graminis f. sp. tritici]|uniref:Uncharacterized protein n=1 Tax=Puccinia graminis f. sp. tritici TaxID=56615 RepID=A0A5B0Q982_PUCGR|nr:hypothetical protein PGTUg99_034186 [Puccinia graminis f. sp. tritici]
MDHPSAPANWQLSKDPSGTPRPTLTTPLFLFLGRRPERDQPPPSSQTSPSLDQSNNRIPGVFFCLEVSLPTPTPPHSFAQLAATWLPTGLAGFMFRPTLTTPLFLFLGRRPERNQPPPASIDRTIESNTGHPLQPAPAGSPGRSIEKSIRRLFFLGW